MPVTRSGDLRVAAATVALLAVMATAGVLVSPPADERLPPGSSFSRASDGAAAAYQTLQDLGYSIARTVDPLPSLPAAPRSTVLLIVDPLEPASLQDRRALQAFVAAGGHVLVTGCEGGSFLTGLAPARAADPPKARAYAASVPSPLTLSAPRIEMAAECDLSTLGQPYVPLYEDAGTVAVQMARLGDGVAVWWAASTPIRNGAIDAPGHLELLLDMVGQRDRAVLWDEYYHGQRRSIWSYAAPTPLPWALAQIGLGALMAAAMFVRRRLPVRGRAAEPRTSPLEFVDTMAGLYARAGAAGAAAAMARHHLRRVLIDCAGLSSAIPDDRLAAAAAARLPVDAGSLANALAGAERLASDPSATAEEVLPVVQRLQEYAAVAERGRKDDRST